MVIISCTPAPTLHVHAWFRATKVQKCALGGWEFRMKGRALFSGRELRSGRKEKNKKVEVFFRLSVRRSRHLIGCSPPTLWANWRMILKKWKKSPSFILPQLGPDRTLSSNQKKRKKNEIKREIDIFEWAKKYELQTILNEMADRQNNTTDTKESVREKLRNSTFLKKTYSFFKRTEKWV